MADAAQARTELQRLRQGALLAAAALIGPTVPGGIVDRHPDEAATAVIRVAEMFLPWLRDGTAPPVPDRMRKDPVTGLETEPAAATAGRPDPATGDDDDGRTAGAGPEEE